MIKINPYITKLGTILIVTNVLLINSCSKDEPVKNNILVGTTWSTDDVAANLIYGGKNYLHLKFLNNTQYEIVEIRGGQVKGLYEEGKYTLTNDTDLALTRSKDNKVSTFKIVDSRTMIAFVNGELADKYLPYAMYIKQ